MKFSVNWCMLETEHVGGDLSDRYLNHHQQKIYQLLKGYTHEIPIEDVNVYIIIDFTFLKYFIKSPHILHNIFG